VKRWCHECGHKRKQGQACGILRKDPWRKRDFSRFDRCSEGREMWCPVGVLHIWGEQGCLVVGEERPE